MAQVADPAAGRLTRAPGALGLPRPARCHSRMTPPAAPAAPAVVATKLAYIPAGPGRACWAEVGQANAGSSRWWRSCTSTRATSAGSSSSQVWPKARPASWPGGPHQPARRRRRRPGRRPAADRQESGCRGRPVVAGGQAASGPPPDTASTVVLQPLPLGLEQRPVLVEVGGDQPPRRGRPGLGQPRLPARVDGPKPGSRGGLAGPLDRLACGRARRGSGGVGDRRLGSARAGGPCSRWTDSRRRAHRRRSVGLGSPQSGQRLTVGRIWAAGLRSGCISG